MTRLITAFVVAVILGTGVPAHAQGIEWEILNEEVVALYQQGQYDRTVIAANRSTTFWRITSTPYFAFAFEMSIRTPSTAMPPSIPNGPPRNANAATMAAPPARPYAAMTIHSTTPGMPRTTIFSTTLSLDLILR